MKHFHSTELRTALVKIRAHSWHSILQCQGGLTSRTLL